ncbi:MAG TPA: Ig-like domain-containing protein, partial [Micromonosporaceae bacterium]|nr:Ig-like domain-containing protein [Micromonosporaceae bacterium]
DERVQGVSSSTFTVTNLATGAGVQGALTSNTAGTKWILNPNVNLAADTRYRVTLTGGPTAIRDTANAPFATESWEFLTGPRPGVKSRTPAVNATGVSRTGNVTVTFNEAVQGVTNTTFTLKTAAGASVDASVRPGTTNQWILDPALTLAQNTKYTATVTTAVRDAAGNPLAANVVWSFTTGTT